jgi:hypothetical protein
MGGHSHVTKKTRNADLARGLKKHYAPDDTLTLQGERIRVAALIDLLAAQIALLDQSEQEERIWRGTVRKEKALEARLRPLFVGLRDELENRFGRKGYDKLAAFGLVPRRKTGPKTPKVKKEMVKKAAATRAARGTKPGPKGRRKRKRKDE